MSEEPQPPPVLYKFASAYGAIKMIEGRSIWWRRPDAFNDLDDCWFDPTHNILSEDVTAQVISVAEEIVFGTREYSGVRSPSLLADLLRMRAARVTAQDSRWLAMKKVLARHQSLTERIGYKDINDTVDLIRSRTRVLCLTEDAENEALWAYYGDEHRGAAVGLAIASGSPETCQSLRKVEYSDEVLGMLNAREWAEYLIGTMSPNFGERVLQAYRTKKRRWAHEREWRGFLSYRVPPVEAIDGVTPISIASELTSVHLGVRIKQEDRVAILKLAEGIPGFEVWQRDRGTNGKITARLLN